MERFETVIRIAALALALSLLAAPSFAQSLNEREVEIDGGRATLHGTLMLPPAGPARDVALILPGSGPTDRNGNFPEGKNDSLKMLADGLAQKGIATLRIDTRGVGASLAAAPDEAELRAETFVEDAVAWADFLKSEMPEARLFLIGHSEGALLASLAAQQRDMSGIVLIAGVGRPAPDLIREQISGSSMSEELKRRSDELLETLKRGETDDDVPRELMPLYRPSVQPYLISWFAYDPAAAFGTLTIPALIIHGSHDLQVRTADAALLAAARPDATFITIERMNHVLKSSPLDRPANMATYADPALPLAQGLTDAIADFIAKMAAPE
ncbi:MAG: alpha/beta hydrolase [Alphaproteobacteria bacterium]|nr:alpha/beta hydrolase [Alphaproteobacteria bacterium]MDX5492961.1 alpha/beta hydrolase [Alphaproteobacteria bacterium]